MSLSVFDGHRWPPSPHHYRLRFVSHLLEGLLAVDNIHPIFFTRNIEWCQSAPLGWTYVLINQAGLVKIGKTENKSVSHRTREYRHSGGHYLDYRFLLAFSDHHLEPLLHQLFTRERLCYLPRNRQGVGEGDYLTAGEVQRARRSDPERTFRKVNKELFKFECRDVPEYLLNKIATLGYLPIEMATPDDVLPYHSEITKVLLSALVTERAKERLKLGNPC